MEDSTSNQGIGESQLFLQHVLFEVKEWELAWPLPVNNVWWVSGFLDNAGLWKQWVTRGGALTYLDAIPTRTVSENRHSCSALGYRSVSECSLQRHISTSELQDRAVDWRVQCVEMITKIAEVLSETRVTHCLFICSYISFCKLNRNLLEKFSDFRTSDDGNLFLSSLTSSKV